MKLSILATNKKNNATGYGRLEIGLVRGLSEVGLTPHDKTTTAADGVNILIGSPEWVTKYNKRGGRFWAFTMSESTRVSDAWVNCLNQYYERVLVCAPGLVDIYRDSGVTIPIHYVPLGVDYADIPVTPRPRNPDPFIFLAYSLGDTRKGAELAMWAFKRLFADNPRFQMVVKCRDNPNWLTGLEDDQITIVRGEMGDADWHALLARCHCFVFPSRGEGWGMPPREAVLSGMPTIATEWLGMFDVECWGYPISILEMRPSQFDIWEANAEGGLWAEPNQEHMERHMRYVVNNYEASLQRTLRGRKYLLGNYRWAHTAQRIKELLEHS